MRLAGVVLATMLALALQTALARYFRGAGGVDPVLIVVIYAALAFGPITATLDRTAVGSTGQAMLEPAPASRVNAILGLRTGRDPPTGRLRTGRDTEGACRSGRCSDEHGGARGGRDIGPTAPDGRQPDGHVLCGW